MNDQAHEHMAALSILCQGYLIRHALIGDTINLQSVELADDDDVQDALNIMGARDVPPEFISSLREQTERSNVTDPEYWSIVADAKSENLASTIGPYSHDLVLQIRQARDTEISSVARAFLELVALLGPAENETIVVDVQPLVLPNQWDLLVEEIQNDSRILYSMDWRKFEDLVAALFEKFGWTVQPMGYSKDDGIDIIAARCLQPGIDFRMMVQCKRLSRSRKVEMDIVKQLWATKTEHSFNQAMIATTSSFTRGAKKKAALWNLELKDHTAIVEWCKMYMKS